MTPVLSIVMPYYRNPTMLALHYGLWAKLPEWIRAALQVVIVDDGSPEEQAIDVPRPDALPALEIYRVLEDRPWHQHGARNLGADRAAGEWLLLTDMDHVVPLDTLVRILQRQATPPIQGHAPLDPGKAYMFPRVEADTFALTLDRHGNPKPHPNTFLVTRERFWKCGGYDEDYCGIYGTDGLFRPRLFDVAPRGEFDAPILRYSRAIVHDASTRDTQRKEGRTLHAKKVVRMRKMQERRENKIVTLNFPWERQL